MFKKFNTHRYSVILSLLVAAVLVSGCGAIQDAGQTLSNAAPVLKAAFSSEIAPVLLQDTLTGMEAALNGLKGTYIYASENSNLVVLGWPIKDMAGWVILDKFGNFQNIFRDLCGNKACPAVATEFIVWLENNGWKAIPATSVPTAVAGSINNLANMIRVAIAAGKAIGVDSAAAALAAGSQIDTFIILLPAELVVTDPVKLVKPTPVLQ